MTGFYLRGDVGAGYLTSPGPANVAAFTGGGGIGYQFSDNFRADVTGDWTSNYNVAAGATLSTAAVMGNVYFDWKNDSPITPYVGVGAGYGWVNRAGIGVNDQGVALGATVSPTLGTIGFVVVPIAFVSALTSHLMGTHFDVPSDRLSYPYFAWRLGLPLSSIRDANAQTINKRGIDVLASLGEKNPKHKTIHHYHVNLSGDFGARRLMFRSKFNRDQFLSILRAIRPNVRITRWS